jgi:hypothetical protein
LGRTTPRLKISERWPDYADEDKRIMAAVARLISDLVEGTGTKSNVVSLR